MRFPPMRLRPLLGAFVGAAFTIAAASPSAAQGGTSGDPAPVQIFASEDPLSVTLVANMGRLKRDKADEAPYRAGTIAWAEAGGESRSAPLRLRTRGIWRLKNCQFPPIRLNFARGAVEGTPFEGLDKPKLVNYCRDDTRYEQLVLQELQLYRIFALLTPVSHRTRLLRITYVDSAKADTLTKRYAFLLEEPDALAARLGHELFELRGAKAHDLNSFHAALVGVFQYLIGNSDWSAGGLHNAELVRDTSAGIQPALLLIPYDFDFSGAVNAPYATTDPSLPIKDVRERLYRGHCAPVEEYERVFTLFRERKDAIYALYSDAVGKLMEPRRVKDTLEYFDNFYDTINSERMAKRAILDRCLLGQ